MIVRTGSKVIDYGPTPAPAHAKGSVSGVMVVPLSQTAQNRYNEWRRQQRKNDPEWAERNRETQPRSRAA